MKKTTYLALALASIYVVAAANLPITLLFNSPHDDALSWELARNITNGDWLGPFSNRTLLKGSGFSIFLALSSVLGVPSTISLGIVHALACLAFFAALRISNFGPVVSFAAFIFILFSPYLVLTRLSRDYFYASLLIALISISIIILRRSGQRLGNKKLFFIFGLVLSGAFLTREESGLILPGVALLMLALFSETAREKKRLIELTGNFLIATTAFAVPQFLVATANYVAYEKFTLLDRGSTEFLGALNALYGAVPENQTDYVPVPAATRQVLYSLSPKFNELSDYLETEGKIWTGPGCSIYPETCGDYATGWFEFALRDAMASRGYYSSPESASKYFKDLKREIDSACSMSKIHCAPIYFPLVPLLSETQMNKIPSKFILALEQMWAKREPITNITPSTPLLSRADADVYSFLGKPVTKVSGIVSGWYKPATLGWIQLSCDGKIAQIQREPSSDLVAHFSDNNVGMNRFSFTSSQSKSCYLEQTNHDGKPLKLDELSGASKHTFYDGSTLFIDINESRSPAQNALSEGLWIGIEKVYKSTSPFIAVLFILAFLLTFSFAAFGITKINFLHGTVFVLTLLLMARLSLLAIMDLSMFPAFVDTYLQPAFAIYTPLATLTIAHAAKIISPNLGKVLRNKISLKSNIYRPNRFSIGKH